MELMGEGTGERFAVEVGYEVDSVVVAAVSSFIH